MNLKFKSSEPDLKFNIQSQFRIINGNILYLTREIDLVVRMIRQLTTDKQLQTQVDKFYVDSGQDTLDTPEDDTRDLD